MAETSNAPEVTIPWSVRPGDRLGCSKVDPETGDVLEAWSAVAPDGSLYPWIGDFTPRVLDCRR